MGSAKNTDCGCESEPMRFSKWEGLGNDFVLLVVSPIPENAAALARAVCDRHFGVGADGLIFVSKSRLDGGSEELRMDIYNADGSCAAMCGNGIRCVAALASLQGLVDVPEFAIDTRSGQKRVAVARSSSAGALYMVGVNMGKAKILARETCALSDGRVFNSALVDMGNLHRVVLMPEADGATVDVVLEGSRLESSACGPANVEFVSWRAAAATEPEQLDVKVWEKGVGVTLACGTGACASFAAARELLSCGDKLIAHLPGGDLELQESGDGSIRMTGPAREVFTGTWPRTAAER